MRIKQNDSTTRLETLCTRIIDCPHSTPKWKKKGVFVIRNFNIKQGCLDFYDASYVDEDTYRERTRNAVPEPEDLVISREAPMGEVCMIPHELRCCLGQRLVLIKVNKEICNPYYLLFAIQSQYVQAQIGAADKTGSIVSNLNIPDLKKMRIPVVNRKEQDKIGHVLSLIGEKIQLNNRINSELEAITKAIYNYWFEQFEFPNEDSKPYKSNGGKMVWNEKLKREIPEGWDVGTLENKIEFQRGISYSGEDIKDNTGIPMINLASIGRRQNYIPEGIKYYEGVFGENHIVKNGDMLLACTDLTRLAEIVGCPIWVPTSNEGFIYSMDLAKINILDNTLSPSYLYMTLRTDYYHKYIKGFATGTNVLHLNLKGVKWYSMKFPIKELQTKFHEIVSPMYQKIQEKTIESKGLESLRDFLLPMLMNGQVTIKSS